MPYPSRQAKLRRYLCLAALGWHSNGCTDRQISLGTIAAVADSPPVAVDAADAKPDWPSDISTDSADATIEPMGKACGLRVTCESNGCVAKKSDALIIGPANTVSYDGWPVDGGMAMLLTHNTVDGLSASARLVEIASGLEVAESVTSTHGFRIEHTSFVEGHGFAVIGRNCGGNTHSQEWWQGLEGSVCSWSIRLLKLTGEVELLGAFEAVLPHGAQITKLADGTWLVLFSYYDLPKISIIAYWLGGGKILKSSPLGGGLIAANNGPHVPGDPISTAGGFSLVGNFEPLAEPPDPIKVLDFDFEGTLTGTGSALPGKATELLGSSSWLAGKGETVFGASTGVPSLSRVGDQDLHYWLFRLNGAAKVTLAKELVGAPPGMGPFGLMAAGDGGYYACFHYQFAAGSPVHLARLSPNFDLLWTKLVLPGSAAPTGDITELSWVPNLLEEDGVKYHPVGSATQVLRLDGKRICMLSHVHPPQYLGSAPRQFMAYFHIFDNDGNLLCGKPP